MCLFLWALWSFRLPVTAVQSELHAANLPHLKITWMAFLNGRWAFLDHRWESVSPRGRHIDSLGKQSHLKAFWMAAKS